MSRYEEKTTEEIADYLALSKKTVENHLRLGRRDVRQYMAAIV
jgi:RNA polymerase ECF-type sigma factor